MFLKKHKFKLIPLLVLICAFANPISAVFAENEIRYLGEGAYWQDNETVYCDSVEVTSYKIPSKVPMYTNTDVAKDNTCAPTAGANVVGYYDRWCTELIPNFEPGRAYGPVYIFSSIRNNSQIQTMFDSLYSLMETNVGSAGTSQRQFQNGLTSYANEKGYKTIFQSVASGGKVNLSALETQLKAGKIGVMFCSAYNFVSNIMNNGTNVAITRRSSNTHHMLVAYGYSVYRYYRNNQCFRTDTFLDVASCTNLAQFYQIDLGGHLNLQDMMIVEIKE